MSFPYQKAVQSTIRDLQTMFGIDFENEPQLLWQAMQQSEAANKRLAIVGDAAAALSMYSEWFQSTESRGKGDKRRQMHLSNINLARRGRALGIDRYIQCNAGTEYIADSMVATTMEALLGAAFFVGGIGSVAQMLSVMNLGLGLAAV